MRNKPKLASVLAGGIAGIVNGLFGAGGGMILVPLLRKCNCVPEDCLFPTSVSIILPISIVSLCIHSNTVSIAANTAAPYLIGGCIGGVVAGFTGKKIPAKWLHRFLGAMILWGGVKYLC